MVTTVTCYSIYRTDHALSNDYVIPVVNPSAERDVSPPTDVVLAAALHSSFY